MLKLSWNLFGPPPGIEPGIGDTLEKSALISTMEDLRRPGLALACLLLSESGAGLSADLMKAEEEKMSLALAVAKVDLPSCSSLSEAEELKSRLLSATQVSVQCISSMEVVEPACL